MEESNDSISIVNKENETTKLINSGEDASFNQIHKISLIIVMAIGFIANVEYGIVMPSLLAYVESVGGNNNDLGWALAMFSLAQVIFLPLVGIWADKRTMKEALIGCLVIGITGNVVYAMSVKPIMIIIGRFIAGIGSSNMAITTSYIAAVSTKEQRTKYNGIINGINAIGLVAGPAFNLGINAINTGFWIGKVHFIFDPLRSPGWFLAILLFLTLVSFILFKEPTYKERSDIENNDNVVQESTVNETPGGENSKESLEKQIFIKKSASHLGLNKYSNTDINNNSNNKYKYNTFSKYQSINNEEDQNNNSNYNNSLIYRINNNSNNDPISSTMITPHSSFSHFSSRKIHKSTQDTPSPSLYKINKKEPTFLENFKKILDASLLTCFVINFVQNFVFGVLETLITPITAEQYGFKTLQNSIMYSCVSLEIIVFIIFTLIVTGKGGQDKHVILFGMIFLGGGLILMMIFFGIGLASDKVPIWKFILSVAITTVGIPTQNTSVYSLYSKLLNRIYGDDETQGFASGFMMLMGSAARILGPLWAGYGLEMVRRLPLFIVLIAMFIFDISIVLLFWKKLTFKFDPNAKSGVVISH
ncbi:hypothetical protein DICPUDRAFT_78651 [Dictyostelium purpureum]|uniref:Major facilitator superfamily (MFS) profile domain-containing protein n=1 Tax=Dictyostelium purpureum TaxID=5786 RepID=F0ZK54_DICPU|nr:uncharacterized protein DICPUDRAFT_78651 [Dictyostelium purpureum]EGC35664.1 hypothetical protein DICPUDRAFT_78651 [Dictyostelium purpureum]|eukprot:XP_003287797.1 hypothetical protein DICPUDRAFT_78651 [Dictyostelium purpureum]